MKHPRFEQILRCLHLVNNEDLIMDKNDPMYDKFGKVRWLVERFVSRCKTTNNCHKHIACDKTMLHYRGMRCEINQYMTNKPVKYRIKVWAAVST